MHKHGHGRGLDRISARHLQAVRRRAHGRLEQRAARVRAWRANEDAALIAVSMSMSMRKRKPVEMSMAMEEDGASRVTDGEEYRSAVSGAADVGKTRRTS